MTTRAIKKLVKKDDLKDLELKLNENLESEESEEESFIPRNKFDLVFCLGKMLKKINIFQSLA